MHDTTPKQALGRFAKATRALRYRNYRWYWLSGLGQTGGQGMHMLTLPWLVLELTGSVAQLGIVVFMQGLPMAIISLVGGVMADRFDRKMVLMASKVVMMVNISLLGLLTVSGNVALWHVYASAILAGTTNGLTSPARQALIRSLVGKDDVMSAVSLNATQMTSSRIIWPSLAGAVIAGLGVGGSLLVNAGFYLFGLVCLLFITGVPKIPPVVRKSPAREMADGLRFTRRTPVIFAMMSLGYAFALLGMPYMQMTPGFAREVFNFDAGRTGLLMMFSGIGSLLGSVALLIMGDVKRKNSLYVGLVFSLGISLVLFSINPWVPMAFVLMAWVGFSGSTSNVVGQTMIQAYVPKVYLGRVFSLWMAAAGLISVMALPIGFIGETWGLRWGLGVPAALLIGVTLWLGVLRPTLRRTNGMPALSDDEQEPAAAKAPG